MISRFLINLDLKKCLHNEGYARHTAVADQKLQAVHQANNYSYFYV